MTINIKKAFESLFIGINERDREIFKLYHGFYEDRCIMSTISKRFSISKEYVRLLLNRTYEALQDCIEPDDKFLNEISNLLGSRSIHTLSGICKELHLRGYNVDLSLTRELIALCTIYFLENKKVTVIKRDGETFYFYDQDALDFFSAQIKLLKKNIPESGIFNISSDLSQYCSERYLVDTSQAYILIEFFLLESGKITRFGKSNFILNSKKKKITSRLNKIFTFYGAVEINSALKSINQSISARNKGVSEISYACFVEFVLEFYDVSINVGILSLNKPIITTDVVISEKESLLSRYIDKSGTPVKSLVSLIPALSTADIYQALVTSPLFYKEKEQHFKIQTQ